MKAPPGLHNDEQTRGADSRADEGVLEPLPTARMRAMRRKPGEHRRRT